MDKKNADNLPEIVKDKRIFNHRPQRTLKTLPQDWENVIIDMMKEGASIEEIKAFLGISDAVYYRFMREEPDFISVMNRGKQLSKAWWLEQGRKNLENTRFSPTLWYMNMKNRFGWVDKQEHQHTIDVPTRITIKKEEKVIELLPPKKGDSGEEDDY